MAEGTSLLRMHTAYTCIVGSNPTVSARKKQKAPARELFPLTPPGDEGAICMAPAWDSKGCPYLGSPLRIVHLLCATRTAQRAVGALPIHTCAVKHAPQRLSSRKARRPQSSAQAEPVSQCQTRPPPSAKQGSNKPFQTIWAKKYPRWAGGQRCYKSKGHPEVDLLSLQWVLFPVCRGLPREDISVRASHYAQRALLEDEFRLP